LPEHEDGHGLGPEQVSRGKASYYFNAKRTVRFVVMDTAAEHGGAQGPLPRRGLEQFVVPAIEDAKALSRVVILTSPHHADDEISVCRGSSPARRV